MRLVTIECREVAGRPGVVTGAGDILDLAAAPSTLEQAQWIPQSVVSILAAGEDGRERVQRLLDSAATADPEALRAAGVLLTAAQTHLMAPIRRPGLVLVVESRDDAEAEPQPVVSIKSPNTVVGPAKEIRVPWRAVEGLQVRPLLGVVLGRPLHRASADEVAAAIGAYTALFDLSHLPPAPASGAGEWRAYLDSKQFPGACPVGPALVTADEWPPDAAPPFVYTVNGVTMAQGQCPLAPLPAMLASLSARYGFRPGDVVGVELPTGGADPRNYQDGDRLALELGDNLRLEATLRF